MWVCASVLFLLAAFACFPGAAQELDAPCDFLHKSGLSALEKHQYSEAANEFERALDVCPTHRAILLELSEAYAHNRDFPSAIRAAGTFLESEPNSVPGTLT